MFEVLLALGVMALITVAIVSVSTVSIRNNTLAKNKTEANKFLNEVDEWLRMRKDTNFDSFQAHGRGNDKDKWWCADTLPGPTGWFGTSGGCIGNGYDNPIQDTIFYREVSLDTTDDANDNAVVEAKTKVYWSDSQGRHETNSVTYYTDW